VSERATKTVCAEKSKRSFPSLSWGGSGCGKEVNGTNRHSGRKMSDAIFIVNRVSGDLTIGDEHEIDKAIWRKPHSARLTPTSRYIRDMLFPKG
jgi:8-oxo-dGTP diphosphatase